MPRAATAAARSAPAVERPARKPVPRRRSGPARQPTARASAARAGGATAAAPALRLLPLPRLSVAGLLDRLMRGRVWVVLIGVLLVGIVFFNVSVMRLNQTITRDSARATALRQENSRLGVEAARLSSSERIQRLAVAHGFVLPIPKDVKYLDVNHLDAIRASHRIVPPQIAVVPPPQSQVPLSQIAPTTNTGASGATGAAGATGTTGAVGTGTTGTGQTGTTGSTQPANSQTGTTQTGTTGATQTGTTTGAATGGVTSGGGTP
jgi:cell division protein FtsL